MTSGRRRCPVPILLDTGAAELLRRRERRVEILALRRFPPLLCSHVVAEFLFGQLHAGVAPAVLAEAQSYLGSFEILQPTPTTAAIYARLRVGANRRGLTLPDPDYWIAAHALEQQMELVSTDRHLLYFPEIKVHYISPSKP
jgi:predicted nucleic acid-binding protein